MKNVDVNLLVRRAKRVFNGLNYLRVIDILLLFPEFVLAVDALRKKLNIVPDDVEKELELIFGKYKYSSYKKFEEFLDKSEKNGLLDEKGKLIEPNSMSWEEFGEMFNQIEEWEKSRYPELYKNIGIIRTKVFGKIPRMWSLSIKDYILYNKRRRSFYDDLLQYPIISYEHDSENEVFLNIKIYGDSAISVLSNKKYIRNMLKKLPTYFQPEQDTSENLEKRALYYKLRTKDKLGHEAANIELKKYDFEPIDYQYASQEMKGRFAGLFFSESSPMFKKRVRGLRRQKNST